MKIGYFYYPGFVDFEVALCWLMFKDQETFSFALNNKEVISMGKQRYLVDKLICEVNSEDVDLIIIPGGEPGDLLENEELRAFFNKLPKTCKIAAICGGTGLLASLGMLKDKKCTGDASGITDQSTSYKYFTESELSDDHIVVDGNIITGQGQAFVAFAMELALVMGLFQTRDEMEQTRNWFLNVRG